jgi:hypothetical protein
MILIIILVILVTIILYKYLPEKYIKISSQNEMKPWDEIKDKPAEIDGKFYSYIDPDNNKEKKLSNYQILSLFLIALNYDIGFNSLISDDMYTRLNTLFQECYNNKSDYIEKAIKLINENEIMDTYYSLFETFENNDIKLNKPMIAAGVIVYDIDDKDMPNKYEFLVKLLYKKDPIYLNYACETFINLNKNISLRKMLFNIDYVKDVPIITTSNNLQKIEWANIKNDEIEINIDETIFIFTKEQIMGMFIGGVFIALTRESQIINQNDNLYVQLNRLFIDCFENKTNYIELAIPLINKNEVDKIINNFITVNENSEKIKLNLNQKKILLDNLQIDKGLIAVISIIPENISDEQYEYLIESLYNYNPIYLDYSIESIKNQNKNISMLKIIFNIDNFSDLIELDTTNISTTSVPTLFGASTTRSGNTSVPLLFGANNTSVSLLFGDPTTRSVNTSASTTGSVNTSVPLLFGDPTTRSVNTSVPTLSSIEIPSSIIVSQIMTEIIRVGDIKTTNTTMAPISIAQTTMSQMAPIAPRSVAQTTMAPRSVAQTTMAARTVAQTTMAARTVAQTTMASRTVSQTTIAARTVAQTTMAAMAARNVAQTTMAPRSVAQTTMAPTTMAPRSVAQTTMAPRNVAQTTMAPRNVAQTTMAPRSIFQTTMAPRTVFQTTITPRSVAQTTTASRSVAQTTTAPRSVAQTTTAPRSIFQTTTASRSVAQTTTAPRSIFQTTMARTVPQTTGSVNPNISEQNFAAGIQLGGL